MEKEKKKLIEFIRSIADRIEKDDYSGMIAIQDEEKTHIITREDNPIHEVITALELSRQINETALEHASESMEDFKEEKEIFEDKNKEKEDFSEKMKKKAKNHKNKMTYVG